MPLDPEIYVDDINVVKLCAVSKMYIDIRFIINHPVTGYCVIISHFAFGIKFTLY